MKFKGLGFALTVCLALLGCGGGGGSSTNIYLREVILVHPAAVGGTFGSDDFTISGSQSGNVVTQVSCPTVSGFNQVTSTTQTFTATDTSTSPNLTLGTYTQSATSVNGFYTLYVTGVEGSSTYAPAVALVQENPPAATSTNAWVRFANFSTSAGGAVDVYITTSPTSTLTGTTPQIAGAGYGQPTNYVSLTGGTYYVRITPTGSPTNVLYTSPAYTFANGFYYSNYGWDTQGDAPTLYTYQDIY